jgi:hypothetical protein
MAPPPKSRGISDVMGDIKNDESARPRCAGCVSLKRAIGKELAEDIYDNYAMPLISRGTVLTEKHLSRIKTFSGKKDFVRVYI